VPLIAIAGFLTVGCQTPATKTATSPTASSLDVVTGHVFRGPGSQDVDVIGNGAPAKEAREVSEFSYLDCCADCDVIVELGKPLSLSVSADSNLLDRIETKHSGYTLDICFAGKLHPTGRITVQLCCPHLPEVVLSNGAHLMVSNANEDKTRLVLFESTSAVIVGRADTLDAEVSDSANLDARQLFARNASISLMGSGTASINVSTQLNVTIRDSGDLFYRGNPTSLQVNIMGTGHLRHE
jgi:hypothetical protein